MTKPDTTDEGHLTPSPVADPSRDADPDHNPELPSLRRPTHAMSLMLTGLLVLALVYTLALCQTLVVPLVLAMFLGLGLNPLVAGASRLHVPRAVSALIVMLAVGAGSVGAVTLLAPPAVKWIQQAPSTIRHDVMPKLRPLTRKLDQASRATQSITGNHGSRHSDKAPAAHFDLWDVVTITPRVLAFTLTVGLLVFFFLIFGDRLLLKLVEVSPSFASKRDVVTIVRNIQSEVSRYIFTVACINFMLGAITAGILWWLGMPDPLLWGGLAGVANFVPYVGAISMTLVLAVAGGLHFDHLLPALVPAMCFASLTAIEGNMITPLIVGQRLRLSPVAILIWLVIWAWLWGIAGALLAVPMLTTVKLITQRIAGWEWFAHLIGR